ncbi:MAG: helix-turn-helix transcriptional regulator [Acidimicrobiales bacterium]
MTSSSDQTPDLRPTKARDTIETARTTAGGIGAYARALVGVEVECVRAGPQVASTEVVTVTNDRFTFGAGRTGFPMFSRTTIPDDAIVLLSVRAGGAGNRWCEIDLSPGLALVHGPESEHISRSQPGLEFAYAISKIKQIEAFAEQHGIDVEMPARGEGYLLPTNADTALVGSAFAGLADVAVRSEHPSLARIDLVMLSLVLALRRHDSPRRIGGGRRIDSRHVVRACIAYADSIDRIPSIGELCLAAHVSERRLREAFSTEFDTPPTQFFRTWALDRAHRRLREIEAGDLTVTEVATRLGFDHLGRFAGRYRSIYGESPSETLAAT